MMKKEISMFEKKLDRLQEQIFKMRGMLNAMKELKEGKYNSPPSPQSPKVKSDSGIVYDLHTKKRIK